MEIKRDEGREGKLYTEINSIFVPFIERYNIRVVTYHWICYH
jgi:hypothetical protein